MKIDFNEIENAFMFISMGARYEHAAYLCKETGKIYYHSELTDDIEELPDDLDDPKYVSIPDKNELDLGQKLVMDFGI